MIRELSENFDTKRLDDLPQLSLAEAAWMAGITPDAFERFLDAASLGHLRTISLIELVRSSFTQLGQREAQLAMFRLQLAAALHREKELAEALHSKLTAGSAELFTPRSDLKPSKPPSPPPPSTSSAPSFGKKNKIDSGSSSFDDKPKKRKKKK